MQSNVKKQFDIPPFRPHPLLRGPHRQTIVATYLPVRRWPTGTEIHEVLLADGDRIVLHENCPVNWNPPGRAALLMHGLGGCHASPYMLRIAEKLSSRGVRAFRMDLRGCGAGFDKARGHYHAGKTDDLAAVIDYLHNLCPAMPLSLLGFSMSGNIVLRLLGEMEHAVPPSIDCAVAVAPPIDLLACAQHLRRGANRFIDQTFMRRLHADLQRRRRAVAGLHDRRLRPLPARLFQFDDQFTAPLIGFSGAEEYYTCCSSAPLLHRVRVPTLLLTSADDPVIPVRMFERYPLSSAIHLHITSHGGHVGFIAAGGSDPDRRWLDWRIVDWIEHHQEVMEPSSKTIARRTCSR